MQPDIIFGLRKVIDQLTVNPLLIHHPDLSFFRNFITTQYHASIPPPLNSLMHDLLGDAAMAVEEGQYEKAVSLLSHGLIISQDDPQMRAMLFSKRAAAKYKADQLVDALADCSEAIKLNPNDVKALRIDGLIKNKLGDTEGALTILNRAQQLSYDSSIDQTIQDIKKSQNVAEPRFPLMNEKFSKIGGEIQELFKDGKALDMVKDLLQNPSKISQYKDDPAIKSILKNFSL